LADLVCKSLNRLCRARGNQNAGAFMSQSKRYRFSYTLAGASHDSDLVFKSLHKISSS
jgi:hypothetical protein